MNYQVMRIIDYVLISCLLSSILNGLLRRCVSVYCLSLSQSRSLSLSLWRSPPSWLCLFLLLSLYLSPSRPLSSSRQPLPLSDWLPYLSVSGSLAFAEASRIIIMPSVHFNLIELLAGPCNIGLWGCPEPLELHSESLVVAS